jgi:outer membrane receptor protein involved in Fe transport
VTLDAVNILDDAYQYWLDYPEPGTQIYLGLRAKF